MANRIILNTVSFHGKGAIREIPGIVASKNFRHVFVCSDPDLLKFRVTAKVTDLLKEAGIPFTVYSGIKPNPRTPSSPSEAVRRWTPPRPSV